MSGSTRRSVEEPWAHLRLPAINGVGPPFEIASARPVSWTNRVHSRTEPRPLTRHSGSQDTGPTARWGPGHLSRIR